MALGWVASLVAAVAATKVAGWLIAKLGVDGGDSAAEAGIIQLPPRSGVPSQVVIGRARTAGVRAFLGESKFGDEDVSVPTEHGGGTAPTDVRVLYQAVVLSEGEIDDVEAIWVGGRPMPFVRSGDVFGVANAGASALDTELATLKARRTALRGGAAVTDAGLLSLLRPVGARITEIEDTLAWPGWQDAEGNGLVRLYLDKGGAGTSPADSRAARAGWLASAAGGGTVSPGGFSAPWAWPDTMRFDGLAWVWIELVAPKDASEHDWQGIPSIEFLVRGRKVAGKWTDNPATLIAEMLVTQFGAQRDEIVGRAAAETRCAEVVTFPAVALGDDSSTKPIKASQVLTSVYGSGTLPSTSVQNRVVADWNARFAGASNARRRYQVGGVVSSHTDPIQVVHGLAAAMAGEVIDIGGRWRIQAGQALASVRTITEEDIVGDPVTWVLEGEESDRANAVTARLVQDAESDWESWDMPEVRDEAQITADGKALKRLGDLAWITSRLHARRLATLALRQAQPSLRVADVEIAFTGASITPGDHLTTDNVGGWSGVVVVTSVELDLDRQVVRLGLRQEPAGMWLDGWDLPGTDVTRRRTVTARPPTPGTEVEEQPQEEQPQVEWQRVTRDVRSVVNLQTKVLVLVVAGCHVTPTDDEDIVLVWRRSTLDEDGDEEDWQTAPTEKQATASDPLHIVTATGRDMVPYSSFSHSLPITGGGEGLYLQLAARRTETDGSHTYHDVQVFSFQPEQPKLKDQMVRVTTAPTTGAGYPEGTLLCLPITTE